ncbi:hypothetical protein [Thiomicrorhabdus sp.]|uniref:hypothetical protein n=1 Tax=Thiomicrorhabdus sp. TaxID=2039724 RepID=UPI0035672138
MKTAILIHSDPQAGEEALGRVFNGLAVAYDLKQKSENVQVMFLGTGTRWINELNKPEHPVHGLFELVKDKVAGASQGCSVVFGTVDEVKASDINFLNDNLIPGTEGLPSVAKLMAEGFTILVY